MVEFWKGRTYEDVCKQHYTRKKRQASLMLADYGGAGRELATFDYVTPQPDWMYQ
ncbi:MAG: hypothetical protein SVZ03_15920 [Spirochaetota bacterium]|nr:hypothetical protein [Spirochaetota bacterium]